MRDALAWVIYREMQRKETKISTESGKYIYEVSQNLFMVAETQVTYETGDIKTRD